MKIITNNVPRLIIDAYELTEEERKEFDYINWEKIEAGSALEEFVRYKGQLYHLGDLELTSVPGWEGQYVDSMFSAVLFRWAEGDRDRVIVGSCYS